MPVGYSQELHGDEVKGHAGAAALEEGQQPGHLARGVDRSGAKREQSLAHGVHHGRQICWALLGHSAQAAGERGDVGVPIILSDVRGKRCQELVPVARDVVAVPENICRGERRRLVLMDAELSYKMKTSSSVGW